MRGRGSVISGGQRPNRRYIESVDGRAHQQAVEIIGASERERDGARAEIKRLRTERDSLAARVLALEVENEKAREGYAQRAYAAERERDEAVALLREATSDQCVVCHADLQPVMPIPRHCTDCRVDDDAEYDHVERVNDFRARLDAFLAGNPRREDGHE